MSKIRKLKEYLKVLAMCIGNAQNSRGEALSSLFSAADKGTDNRKGFGLISVIIAVVALSAIMAPVTRWYLTTSDNLNDLGTKLEMQSVVQDYWN